MSEVRILSPRPIFPDSVEGWGKTRRGSVEIHGTRTYSSAGQDGNAVRHRSNAKMDSRVRAREQARARPADGLVERARHAQPGEVALRHAGGGDRIRRQEEARLH